MSTVLTFFEITHPEWVGLDPDYAVEATPRRYAVSFGDGNNGVSHTFPDMVVRTTDPFRLAQLAMLSQFEAGTEREWALNAVDVDGEADYTVSATILDPPDDGDRDHSECEDGEECEGCEQCEPDGENSWSATNGAWFICEVFLADPDYEEEQDYEMPEHGVEAVFSPALLSMVPADEWWAA